MKLSTNIDFKETPTTPFVWTRECIDKILADISKQNYEPKKIIKSGDRTIVFWKDDTKTIVRRSDDTADDLYSAFCAALAKKVYGSNSQVKKILRMADIQPMSDRMRKKEAEEYRRMLEARKAREEAERPQKILEQFINSDEKEFTDRIADACKSAIRAKRRTK